MSNGDTLVENVGFIPALLGECFIKNFDPQGNQLKQIYGTGEDSSATQYFGQND